MDREEIGTPGKKKKKKKKPFLFDFEMPVDFVVSGLSLLLWSF